MSLSFCEYFSLEVVSNDPECLTQDIPGSFYIYFSCPNSEILPRFLPVENGNFFRVESYIICIYIYIYRHMNTFIFVSTSIDCKTSHQYSHSDLKNKFFYITPFFTSE